MIRWRLAIAAVLLAAIAVPLALPIGQLAGDPQAWRGGGDFSRAGALARTTALLVAGTLALCVPSGIVGAVLLYRTDLHLRRSLRAVVLLTLFIPLPLFTSGWQAAVGSGGWLPLSWWNAPRPADAAFSSGGNVWTPWGQGIGTAVWIHAAAGLPWVVWLVGHGLRQVDRDLEEDALTATGPWRVLLRVSLPRSSGWIAAAALWVALQTATEITVTDVMQVRTYAEEVYTQFVLADRGSLARAVAVSMPLVLIVTVLVLTAVRRWEVVLSPSLSRLAPPLTFSLGRWRWPAGLMLAAGALALAGVPAGSLMWRAGLSGTPLAWSSKEVARNLLLALRSSETRLVGRTTTLLEISLLVALAAGAVSATLALLACWAARESTVFRFGLVVLMAVAWAMPGPVVGLGLLASIDHLLKWTGPGLLADLLWYGPSFAPVVWADVIRFFPCAVAVFWPAMRVLPAELVEAARVEGAGPLGELVAVVLPLTAGMWLLATLTTAVLALGEVSASKIVATPGGETWVHGVFTQMHYGVTPELAARCLLLLGAAAITVMALGAFRWFRGGVGDSSL